jgi:hypothetical protein
MAAYPPSLGGESSQQECGSQDDPVQNFHNVVLVEGCSRVPMALAIKFRFVHLNSLQHTIENEKDLLTRKIAESGGG